MNDILVLISQCKVIFASNIISMSEVNTFKFQTGPTLDLYLGHSIKTGTTSAEAPGSGLMSKLGLPRGLKCHSGL
jgi:hypothetical protein